jgi:hypothetical protein
MGVELIGAGLTWCCLTVLLLIDVNGVDTKV